MPTTYSTLSTAHDRQTAGLPPSTTQPAPAPWTLKITHAYTFFFYANASNRDAIQPHLVTEEDKRDYKGGLGAVMVIRYEDSPVGAYDELLFCPGGFEDVGQREGREGGGGLESTPLLQSENRPTISSTQHAKRPYLSPRRITRIFVSSEASLRSGRANWGIRKELASFEWSVGRTPNSKHIRVTDLLSKELIFDAALYTHVPWLPIPMFLGGLGRLVPCIEERRIDEDGRTVGEGKWCITRLGGGGWAKVATMQVRSSGGARWPDLRRVGWIGVGGCLEGGELVFGVPEVVGEG
ncbi:hypothetical protein HDV00_003412 [Rhizophlyctis rosea]|nr:hypothetical protein HDV00_003412 [Rhizophlyctis rosea]